MPECSTNLRWLALFKKSHSVCPSYSLFVC